jgi:hypothetical protein
LSLDGPVLHRSLTAASTALRSCFKVQTKRTSEWIPLSRASPIQGWRVVTLPPGAGLRRKLKTSFRVTAPARRFSASTIRACWLVKSDLCLCLAPRRKDFASSEWIGSPCELWPVVARDIQSKSAYLNNFHIYC